jgi:hypothetical protein
MDRSAQGDPERGPRPESGYIGLETHDKDSIVFVKEGSVRPLDSNRHLVGLNTLRESQAGENPEFRNVSAKIAKSAKRGAGPNIANSANFADGFQDVS